jgi:hypothetical protein
MSYAGSMTTGTIQVGANAHRDPILAKASLRASEMLLRAAKRPAPSRPGFLRRELRRQYGEAALRRYTRERGQLAMSRSPDQALYDALRLAIADYYTAMGIDQLRSALSKKYPGRFVPGLGTVDNTGRDVGCAVGGGATAILALVAGAYTAGAAAAPVMVGGSLAMNAAGCNAGSQAAQQQTADAEARAAQAALEAAAATAAAEEAARAQRNKTLLTVAAVGGGILLLGGVGYLIVGT